MNPPGHRAGARRALRRRRCAATFMAPDTEDSTVKTRSKLPILLVAGGLAFGMAACEAEEGGTSPGVEDPAVGGTDTGTDPLAPADDGGLGEG